MDAIEKTKSIQRLDLSVARLDANTLNPNEMSDAEFSMLADNIEKVGITDPILVRPVGDRYRVVGGHHRLEVAKVLGFEEVPCTVITDPDFDDDQEKFQVVRMNVIRGKMSPKKFMGLYETLNNKYTDEIMSDLFGFVDQEDFQKLIRQMAKSLPSDMQDEFKKAAEEIKTVDGLTKLLNSMFAKYGDTLPYGYMLLDFGGKDSVWLRMKGPTRKNLLEVGKRCTQVQRTMDDVLGGLIALAATGKLDAQIQQIVAHTKPVQISAGTELPTEELLGV